MRTFDWEDIFGAILFFALIAMLLSSCRSAYDVVKNDPYRSVKERNKLAVPCSEEFPCIVRGDTTIGRGVDSSDYFAALEAYTAMLDNYIASKDSIITLLKLIEAGNAAGVVDDRVLQDILANARQRDSAQIIADFLKKGYKPPPIIEYRDRIKYQIDSSQMQQLYAEIRACENYQRTLQTKVDNQKPWQLRFWIAVGLGALLIILLIVYLINRLTKIKRLTAQRPMQPIQRPPFKT